MPYVWAKKFCSLDNELQVSTSKMFYPPGISISRKERLSLIWLAANYDPEKYRKIIPPKKCEEANIENICNAIMNPKVPYALRLSAQLMLGTVRVYRTKTKLILEMAEQMILKLSSLIHETTTRKYDMPVAMLRADAITIADTGMSIIDYSLEPVYYDPQMIMHMNEEDFITVNGSPLQSPIKIEQKSHSKKSVIAPTKSPIVVSNSKISFQEDLLSPSKPIQVPTEEDEFGALGFGPAQDNFLTDLMEIADINIKPKALDFGDEVQPTRLEPVFEDDENIYAVPIDQAPKTDGIPEFKPDSPTEEKDPEKMEFKEGVILNEDIPVIPSLPSDTTSRKRKVEDLEDDSKSVASSTAGQEVDLDALLKEAIELNETFMQRSEEIPSHDKAEEVFQAPIEIVKGHEEAPKEINEELGRKEIIDEPAFVVEPVTDKSIGVGVESSVPGVPAEPMDWATNLQTPSDAIILKPLPAQPKKKRKLMVDEEIFMRSKEMRNNFATPEKTVRIPMIAGSALPTGKEMFFKPMFDSNVPQLKFWWENNAVREEGDPIAIALPEDSDEYLEPPSVGPPSVGPTEIFEEEEEEEEEIPMENAPGIAATPMETKMADQAPEQTSFRYDETPSSIDILRADSGGLKSFEQSGGSVIPIKETPVGGRLESPMDNINVDDIMPSGPQSPRISDIQLLPRDIGTELEEPPELDTVLEQDEKSIDFTAGWLDDNDILTKEYKTFQRKIFHSLHTSDATVFQRLFPSSRTQRRDAALALYLTLNMHKNGYVKLQQTELFGDIYIQKAEKL